MLLGLAVDIRLKLDKLRIRYNGLFGLCLYEIQCLRAISQSVSRVVL